MSARLSVQLEQLGYQKTDFHEIWYLRFVRKFVEEIQDLLKYDKKKGYFTWRPIYIFLITSRSFLLKRNVPDKRCRENQNTYFVFSNCFFSSKIMPFMRKCGKILYSRIGHRWLYGACALHDEYQRLQTHTQNMWHLLLSHCNIGCTNSPQRYVIRSLPLLLFWFSNILTFRHRASCILDSSFTTLQRTLLIYLINKYISLSDICLTVHHWYK
jgi:hypothetical protein